jgi:lysine 6-dehydrogenase
MRALVIGSGKMGKAIAADLQRNGFKLTVCDADAGAAASLGRELGCASAPVDATRATSVVPVMKGQDVCVSAVPYFLNAGLARMAVEARCHFVDLGGNEAVVREELALDRAARKRGVCLVPDCGLAPGMVSFLVAWGIGESGRPSRVRIRVGGLPQRPKPPLNYQIVFSVHGLINEYSGWCTTLRNYKPSRSRAMSGVERVEIPGVGELEAFHTSGGASTLPGSYAGRVRDLDYKTLRYPGHCAKMKGLMKRLTGDALREHLEKTVPSKGPDLVAVKVTVDDWGVTLVDRATGGHSAMMRTTGYSAAIVAALVARGRAKRTGALIQERDFDPREFVGELLRRGFALREHD